MTARKIVAEAADPRTGMTLDELGELVGRAMKLGATGREVVEVTTAGIVHPRIKTAKVTIGQPEPTGGKR